MLTLTVFIVNEYHMQPQYSFTA